MGRQVLTPYSIISALKVLTLNGDNNDYPCDLCHHTFSSACGLYIHRYEEHPEDADTPTVCDECLLPLFEESYSHHFGKNHYMICCSLDKVTSPGEQLRHLILKHPKSLENVMNLSEFLTFHRLTKAAIKEKEWPWGNEIRVLSTRCSGTMFSRRNNEVPNPRTTTFRDMYQEAGKVHSVAKDIIVRLTQTWEANLLMTKGYQHNVIVNLEKLVIKYIGEILSKYQEEHILTLESPRKLELADDTNIGWCEKCKDRRKHQDDTKCIDKTLLESSTHEFLNGEIEDQALELYAGVLVGTSHHSYGTAPHGQNQLINLGFKAFDPLYVSGYANGKPVQFRKIGRAHV